MIRYFCKTLAAHWRANPVLYGLTVVGVALGVASVISIQILNQSAIASFAAGIRTVDGEADVIVTGKGSELPDRVFAQVLGTAGVASAWPIFETTVSLQERPDRLVRVIGLDLLRPDTDWNSLSGLDRDGVAVPPLEEPGWVAASTDLISAMHWNVGERFRVLSGSNVRELRIGASIDVSAPGSGNVLMMDIAQAQSLFGHSGGLDQIGVKTVAPAQVAPLVRRLNEKLGGIANVATPEQRTEEARRLLSAFRLNLTALSLVSLLVGTFLVFSSMRACLVWQRREFGVLRSLGATPGQVLALILVEATLLGVIGVVVGMPVGYWAAVWNLDAVSSTLTNVYLLRELESLQVSGGTLALAGVVGVGGALCGTLLPALDVWRRDTRQLVEAGSGGGGGRSARGLFWLGIAALTAAVGWYWAVGWRWRPAGFVLATAILLSLPLATPYLVQLLTRAVRTPDFGFRYGVRSLGATLANTSFSVSSLAMAVCLLVGITLLVESFRSTLVSWVDRSLRADIYVTTHTPGRDPGGPGLSAEIVDSIGSRSSVDRIDPLRRLFLEVGGRRVSVAGVDLSRAFRDRRFIFLSGSEEAAAQRAFREGGVLVGEPLANRLGVAVGDVLEIEGARGMIRLPVAGIYYDYTEGGSITMDIGLMADNFGPGPLTSLALYLAADQDAERVVEGIKSAFPKGALIVRSNRRLKAEVLDIFDQTFAVTRILQIMSLVIAACAITLTLLVVSQEKRSEIALYQTLGAYRKQIFWLFVNKGTAMACLGLVLGFLGGTGLGAVLIFIIQKSYFGWSIQWTWPWAHLGVEAAAILLAAVIASLYPAARASRTPASELCNADA